MDQPPVERIRQHPDFPRFIERKQRLVCWLTFIMLSAYYGFVLLMAFAPTLLAIPLARGVINLGIVCAALLIVLSFMLTAWYVHTNNRVLDPMLENIHRECQQ